MRDTVYCESMVDYHPSIRVSVSMEQASAGTADLLTRSRIKGSGVLNSNGSSGLGHDAWVTTTSALS